MSIQEYNDSTYGEILCVMQGYSKRIADQSRDEWERARHIAFYAVVAHVKPGSVSRPSSLIPLPWDKDNSKTAFNPDEQAMAMDNVMGALKIRTEKKQREKVKEHAKNVRKHGKPR